MGSGGGGGGMTTSVGQRGSGWRRSQAALCAQASSQRSFQTAARSTSKGLTLGRAKSHAGASEPGLDH